MNTDVYGVTSRSISRRQVVELIARRCVSVSLGERRQNRFPSVLDRPLRRLSALESTSCGQPGSDYRKTVLQILMFLDAVCIQRFADLPASIDAGSQCRSITYGDHPDGRRAKENQCEVDFGCRLLILGRRCSLSANHALPLSSSGAEGEHVRPQPGVARGPSQYVPSSRRSGDQANHSRAIEARDSIGAYVHSTRLADWFAIEQH